MSNIPTNEQAHSSDARGDLSSERARRIQATSPVNHMNQHPASFPRPPSVARIRHAVAEFRDDVQRTIETLQAALENNDEEIQTEDEGYTDEEEEDDDDMFIRDDSDENEDDNSNNDNDAGVEPQVQGGNEVRPVFPVQTNLPHPSANLPVTQEATGNIDLSRAYAVYAELSAQYNRFMQDIEENGFPNKRRKGLNGELISAALTKKVYQPPSPVVTQPPCCSICLDDFQGGEILGILDCGHSYHDICIQGWLQKDNSCPLCRTKGVTI